MKKRIPTLAYMYDIHPTGIWSAIRRRIFPSSLSEDGTLMVDEDDPDFQAWIQKLMKGREETSSWSLTEREEEVFVLLALQDLSQEDVAEELGIQRGTVYFHAKHIYEKIGVRGRIGLQRVARERGLQVSRDEEQQM
jgi:DNA-binding CsgD family transcriptional regulator